RQRLVDAVRDRDRVGGGRGDRARGHRGQHGEAPLVVEPPQRARGNVQAARRPQRQPDAADGEQGGPEQAELQHLTPPHGHTLAPSPTGRNPAEATYRRLSRRDLTWRSARPAVGEPSRLVRSLWVRSALRAKAARWNSAI